MCSTDPAEVGFDAGRLERLDRRLARWVDDGQLPGFLVTVARHGKLVHVGRSGFRNVEAGLPVEDETRWRIFSMTKPITSVAAMMLYEEGAYELTLRHIGHASRLWATGSEDGSQPPAPAVDLFPRSERSGP